MDDNNENLLPTDPSEEELRLENDILKLKMQAEFGASFHEISEDLSPELEQQFLQQVYDFEKAWKNQEMTTVGKLIGNPTFRPFAEIPGHEIETAWQQVLDFYANKNIGLDFIHHYPVEIKYRFATEELPLHETFHVDMPGMMQGFIYEEFHPNHAADMEDLVKSFLEAWFEQDAEKCLRSLSHQLILTDGRLVDQKLVANKLNQLFESFVSLEETDFFVAETSYETQSQDDSQPTLGFVEGAIHWKATMETGEEITFAGPFKFYQEFIGHWSIFNFVMPGFKW